MTSYANRAAEMAIDLSSQATQALGMETTFATMPSLKELQAGASELVEDGGSWLEAAASEVGESWEALEVPTDRRSALKAGAKALKPAECSPDPGEDLGMFGIPTALATGDVCWIQDRIDAMSAAAEAGDELSASDAAFLSDLYWWIGAGGYAAGFPEAAQLQQHYVTGGGEAIEIDAAVYQESRVVQRAMEQMKRELAKELGSAAPGPLERSSTELLKPETTSDHNRDGAIIQGGYLLSEQDNKRLKYTNNRFALKSRSVVSEDGQTVTTEWRVDDVWDFMSFEEQHKRNLDLETKIPLPAGGELILPDGLSEEMTAVDAATVFNYSAVWEGTWSLKAEPAQ